MTCHSEDYIEKLAFIRLTETFIKTLSNEKSPFYFCELFNALINLFANKQKKSEFELQGFFAELYIVLYFYEKGIDIIPFWQKKDKMKFDFTISESKRMEIKSTLKPERIHHFRHEQLLSDLYEIIVVSILLRKSNENNGLSLFSLIAKFRLVPSVDYKTLLYVENFIKNIPQSYLSELCYDEIYIKNNLKFYNAQDIPKFLEIQPPGVTETMYNSDLSTAVDVQFEAIVDWLKT